MHLYAHKESSESPKEQVVGVLFSFVDGMLSLSSARRIDELESRLLRMETLLQETGSSISDAKQSAAPQGESSPSLGKLSRSRTPPTSSASTVSGAPVDSRFNPTNSKLSREAISHLQQRVGSSLASDDESPVAGSGLRVPKRGHTRLPKKDEALVLLMEFLEGFNNTFPLFNPKILLQLFERDYTRDQPKTLNERTANSLHLPIVDLQSNSASPVLRHCVKLRSAKISPPPPCSEAKITVQFSLPGSTLPRAQCCLSWISIFS